MTQIEFQPLSAEQKLSILLGCREDEAVLKLYEMLKEEKE